MFMHFLSHGPSQKEFAKFAESTATQSQVVAATVGVIGQCKMGARCTPLNYHNLSDGDASAQLDRAFEPQSNNTITIHDL